MDTYTALPQPSFGQWLAGQRKARHLTVDALATASGLSRPTLSAIEGRGRTQPRVDAILGIARGLQLPTLAVAIAAGYCGKRGVGQTPDAGIWQFSDNDEPEQRSRQWAAAGFLLMDAIRHEAQLTWDTVARQFGREIGADASDVVRRLDPPTSLPLGWSTTGYLDGMEGWALWALVQACGGDSLDVIALTGLLGRLDPGIARIGGDEKAYEAWVEVLHHNKCHASPCKAAAIAPYRKEVRQVDWHVPGRQGGSQAAESTIPPYGAGDALKARVERAWPDLTTGQRAMVDALLKSWGK